MGAHPVSTRTLSFLEGVFLVFILLLACSAASISIGWSRSSDVRGWWPVLLYFFALVDFAYAWAFMFLTRRLHMSLRGVLTYNTALALLLVLHSVLFYGLGGVPVGGLAGFVRSHSGASLWGLYATFLLGAAISWAHDALHRSDG